MLYRVMIESESGDSYFPIDELHERPCDALSSAQLMQLDDYERNVYIVVPVAGMDDFPSSNDDRNWIYV